MIVLVSAEQAAGIRVGEASSDILRLVSPEERGALSSGRAAEAASRLPEQRGLAGRLIVIVAEEAARIRRLLSETEALCRLSRGVILLIIAKE